MAKKKNLSKFIQPLIIFSIFLIGLLFIRPPQTYLVTKVRDGDTIELADGRVIRYLNLDTPELEEEECFAGEAKEINEELVLGKKVRLELDANEMDRFGRVLAYVFVDDLFVNEYLLREGVAEFQLDTVNLAYQDQLITAAQLAYEEGLGLWQACAPEGKSCVVKGNMNGSGHRFYHLPSFRHYDQVVVNLDKGDRWFCAESEAIEAGFTRARE